MLLLQASIAGAIIIIVILMIRICFLHLLPKKTFLIMWKIALLRLLLPISFSFFLPFFASIQTTPVQTNFNPTGLEKQITALVQENEKEMAEKKKEVMVRQVHFISVWKIIWLIGFFLCSLYFITAYISGYRKFCISTKLSHDFLTEWLKKVNQNRKRKIQIRESNNITAPLTFGIFHPVILMPKQEKNKLGGDEMLEYILTHEYIHIKRFDIIMKGLLNVMVCLHWFNPLIWVMYLFANRDIEISCDEEVINNLGESTKSAYAYTLIFMEERKSNQASFYNSFSKNIIEERIVAIMKKKKRTKLTPFLTILTAGIILVCTFLISIFASDMERVEGASYTTAKSLEGGITFKKKKEEQKEEKQQSIIYESVVMKEYSSGMPYIHDVRKNNTDKTIVEFERGMLAFDKDGKPLKILWNGLNSNSENKPSYGFLYDWDSGELGPLETEDIFGGWSLNIWGDDTNVSEIAYVLYCDKSVTFSDGTVWKNPEYKKWKKEFKGKEVDVKELDNYYPYVQVIN